MVTTTVEKVETEVIKFRNRLKGQERNFAECHTLRYKKGGPKETHLRVRVNERISKIIYYNYRRFKEYIYMHIFIT